MKKILVACWIFISIALAANAQVLLQPTISPVGLVQKKQLWNVLVVNNTTNSYECRLLLVLRDRSTGQELLTATTGLFTLTTGAMQLNANIVAPIQYNNLQSGIDNKLQGLLPVGTYIACYVLTAFGQKEINLAEECVPFDTEPLSPPMLIFPADSSLLEVAPAQFSWIPPTPDGIFNGLHYEVLITPINDGQKPAEAMQENLPFYSEGNQLFTNLNYPSSMPSFEKEKWYAWQVVAKDNGNYAGKSEVWVFKIQEPSIVQMLIEQMPYIKMKKFGVEKGIAPNSILKLSYINETTDSMATARIIDIGDQNREVYTFDIKLQQGENLIKQNLKKKAHLEKGRVYEAWIENSRKEKWVMQFEVQQYEEKKTAIQE
jgi:hypothetical protein